MPGVLKKGLVEAEATTLGEAVREPVREEHTTAPGEVEQPVRPRPRRLGVLVGLMLAVVLAFGGGMLATVLYDRVVATPRRPAPVAAPEAEAAPVPAVPSVPDLTPEQRRALDVQTALSELRASLPPAAVIDIDVKVDGGMSFLTGRVDTRQTLDLVATTVGQVPGVMAVDTRSLRIESRLHAVQPGELLGDIARKYYGRTDLWPRLVEVNPGLDPNRLRPGMEIRVPSAPGD